MTTTPDLDQSVLDGTDTATPSIVVTAWPDDLVESLPGAVATASDEALVWWTPVLGPTAMLMAHRFATYAADGPSVWTAEELCATFGMGNARSRLNHTLARLERFGVVRRKGSVVAVRVTLAPLTMHQRRCLPAYLAEALDA